MTQNIVTRQLRELQDETKELNFESENKCIFCPIKVINIVKVIGTKISTAVLSTDHLAIVWAGQYSTALTVYFLTAVGGLV